MGIRDTFSTLWRSDASGGASPSQGLATLDEVLTGYEILDVTEAAIIAAPVSKKLAASESDLRELGSSSPSPWTSWFRQEYNADMRGQTGLRNLDKMRRSDSTVRSSLRLMKTPVMAGRWFIEPASDSTRDKNVADFVWKNLTKWMTGISWNQVLWESMLSADFGYYMFEKVFDVGENVTADPDARGKIVWRKLAPRHPMDVTGWVYDPNGGPNGVKMYHDETPNNEVFIPIEKLLVFTFDKEAGNMEGMSVLRSAYRNWYYKDNLYKIDAISKERHGIGIPVIKLPPNFTREDRLLADQLGRNLRTNEKAHVVLPPNWSLEFAQLNTNLVDAMKSAEHHDLAINKNILAGFIDDTSTGSQEDKQALFMKASRYVADLVCEVFNKYAIPQLVDFNWSRVGYPELKVRRVGNNVDARVLSFAVRNLVGADALRADEPLETWLREEMDLPKADPDTVRKSILPEDIPAQDALDAAMGLPGDTSPQAPQGPHVGPPRQSQAGNMNNTPPKAGSGRTNDSSGG